MGRKKNKKILAYVDKDFFSQSLSDYSTMPPKRAHELLYEWRNEKPWRHYQVAQQQKVMHIFHGLSFALQTNTFGLVVTIVRRLA